MSNTLSSIYALNDASETMVERYRYDAYGGSTVLDANGSVDGDGLSDVENPYTFTARRLDPASELMQYRNRYYSADLGRFISRDPKEYLDCLNVYVYVNDRPTHDLDPTGEVIWSCIVCGCCAGVALSTCSGACAGSYWDDPKESFGDCVWKCIKASAGAKWFGGTCYVACGACAMINGFKG